MKKQDFEKLGWVRGGRSEEEEERSYTLTLNICPAKQLYLDGKINVNNKQKLIFFGEIEKKITRRRRKIQIKSSHECKQI